jgi:hypothetical protein
MSPKREKIEISFQGHKKFKQYVVDKIHELLMSEEFAEEVAKPGCGLTITSSIEPTGEDYSDD